MIDEFLKFRGYVQETFDANQRVWAKTVGNRQILIGGVDDCENQLPDGKGFGIGIYVDDDFSGSIEIRSADYLQGLALERLLKILPILEGENG